MRLQSTGEVTFASVTPKFTWLTSQVRLAPINAEEPGYVEDPVPGRHGATLLACDIDLDRVARVIGVELDQPA
jgi:hypothetical protein